MHALGLLLIVGFAVLLASVAFVAVLFWQRSRADNPPRGFDVVEKDEGRRD